MAAFLLWVGIVFVVMVGGFVLDTTGSVDIPESSIITMKHTENNNSKILSVVEYEEAKTMTVLLSTGDTSSSVNFENPSENFSVLTKIVNMSVCNVDGSGCDILKPDIQVYWEVENGIGCCHNFGCYYDTFVAFCGTPYTEFKLYDIYLDGEKHIWGSPEEWNYTCSNDKIWNYYEYYDLSPGPHTIYVEQKNCMEIVDGEMISFNVVGQ